MNFNKYRLVKSGTEPKSLPTSRSTNVFYSNSFTASKNNTPSLIQPLPKSNHILIKQTVDSSNKLDDLLKRCSQIGSSNSFSSPQSSPILSTLDNTQINKNSSFSVFSTQSKIFPKQPKF